MPKVLNVPFPYAVLSTGVPVKPMYVAFGKPAIKIVAKVSAGSAMGFVDEHVDVRAFVDLRWQVAKFVDHRDDDAAVVSP